MPRYFRPKGGFSHGNIVSIRQDDDGTTHEVLGDGTERLSGTVDHVRRFTPTWGADELANLVKGGSWEEIPAPDANVAPAESNAREAAAGAVPVIVAPPGIEADGNQSEH